MRPAALAVAACMLVATRSVPAGTDEHGPVLTIERVWCRAPKGRNLLRLFNTAGDLTITPQALTFSTRKRTVEIPLERIRVLSYGTMKGDLDTEWALLGIGESAPEQIVGIRDGSKLGYGSRTWEIYQTLRDALREARAAQFDPPHGFEVFDQFATQFTLAVPDDWHSYLESLVIVGGRPVQGTVVFSARPIRREPAADERPSTDDAALAGVLAGELPGFFVERRAARRGMTCEGLPDDASRLLLELLAGDPLFAGGGAIAGEPAVAAAVVGGCAGLRAEARGRRADGAAVRFDLIAVAQGETLYLFGLRARADAYDERRAPFETALSTVTFSLAR